MVLLIIHYIQYILAFLNFLRTFEKIKETTPNLGFHCLPANAGNTGDVGLIPGWGDPLENEMATHCSILAWRIPWTEEPFRLQSMGSQRLGHH